MLFHTTFGFMASTVGHAGYILSPSPPTKKNPQCSGTTMDIKETCTSEKYTIFFPPQTGHLQ